MVLNRRIRIAEIIMKSIKHRRFVASQPCLITGRVGDDIHPHHLLRAGGKGMGLKACDSLCVPLHFEMHNALHRNGDEEAFFEDHGFSYEIVKECAQLYCKRSPDEKIRRLYAK